MILRHARQKAISLLLISLVSFIVQAASTHKTNSQPINNMVLVKSNDAEKAVGVSANKGLSFMWPSGQVRPISSINGLWRVPLNKGSCMEMYNFTPDNLVYISSASERIIGRYEIQPFNTGEASNLIIKVEYDNAQRDCEGKDHNQSGEVMNMSVVKSNDQQHMRWCEQNNLRNCFLDLERVLP